MLVNGTAANSISADDRGLAYGDGVFRTLRIRQGRPQHWQLHYKKLTHDCGELGIPCPSETTLSVELHQLIGQQSDGIAKIIVTRGAAIRGYAAPRQPDTTRIVSIHPLPAYPVEFFENGISLYLCKLRFAHQPRLAGIKHLNRLENVLAASEWNDSTLPEGLCLDVYGKVVGGTRSNLFMFREGKLVTPDLTQCGVAGVQRDLVISWAHEQDIECNIKNITLDDLALADEIFVVNSAFGLWPVKSFPGYYHDRFPISLRIQKWLNHENN